MLEYDAMRMFYIYLNYNSIYHIFFLLFYYRCFGMIIGPIPTRFLHSSKEKKDRRESWKLGTIFPKVIK